MAPHRGARSGTSFDGEVRALYRSLIDAWNDRDAAGFATCFAVDGSTVGFDGSTLEGPIEIERSLRQIFADHPTARYVTKVKTLSFPILSVGLLRAVVGMVPPGENDVNPAVNAIQSLVAIQREGAWRIALFQNTPAAFHGRPEMVEAHTHEIREMLGALTRSR